MRTESHVLAEDPAMDLAVAEEMVTELEDYIVGNELYRTVIAHTPEGNRKMTMSGGALLSRLRRLAAERDSLPPEMQQRIDAVIKSAEATIYSLRTRFHERLAREMKARLDSLAWFLDEYADDRARVHANYPYEIRNRQRIEEIMQRLGDQAPPEQMARLRSIDSRIRQITHAAPFIWAERLAPAFPQHPYWYLYAAP